MFRSYSENISRSTTDQKHTPVLQTKPYTCDLCEESQWLTETDVELHRKEKHFEIIRDQMNQTERFCTVCMKLQDSHSALVAHVKSRHLLSSPQARRVEREIFICDYCDHIFFNKAMLQAHIMYSHLWRFNERAAKYFPCPKCHKNVKLKSTWFHLQLHNIPSISVCDICLAHLDNLEELEKHLKNHPMFYKCEICSFQVNKEAHYGLHIDQHHKSSLPSHHKLKKQNKIGKVANRAFRRQTHSMTSIMRYNIHQSLRGLDLPRFLHICTLCREICTDKIETRVHLARDHLRRGETKRRFRCRCGEEYFNRVLLKHHVFKLKGNHHEVDPTENRDNAPESSSPPATTSEGDELATMETATNEGDELPTMETAISEGEELATMETAISEGEELATIETAISEGEELATMETAISEGEELATMEIATSEGEELATLEIATSEGEELATMETVSVSVELPNSPHEYLLAELISPNTEDNDASKDDLTYIYAEIDEDQLVTIDSESNEEVIGF